MKETFIQNAPLFSSLSADELRTVGDALMAQTFVKGEVLCLQDQPVQKMYLIQSGWVKQITTLDGGRALVNNLGPGSLVGEMDMLLDQPSSSSAQAVSDVTLWSLSRADLDSIFNEHPLIALKFSTALGSRVKQLEHYLVEHRLRGIPLFSELSDEELAAIAEKLEPLEIRRGGLIFRAGAPGDSLFVVEEGEVMVTSAAGDDGEAFRQLTAGDVLGEMAVLSGKPYHTVARASTEAMLWALRRSDFLELTTRHPGIRRVMSERLSQPLSSEDQAVAQTQLSGLALFAGLPETVMQAVTSVLRLRHYPAGERIFSAGDPGDSLFVVDSGEVRLSGERDSGDERNTVLGSGDYCGEMALLTGRSRTVEARAETDCNLWILDRSDFDELLARYPALTQALSKAVSMRLSDTDRLFLDNRLRGISLFEGIGDVELRDIAQVLHALQFNRGEVIYAEGQRGDALYFIESGEVQIATRVDATYQMNFERLQAGDFFGEIALLADSPRKSTARAVVNGTQLWALYKEDFDRVLVKHPQLALSLSKRLGERLARTRSADSKRPQVKPPTQVKPPAPVRPSAQVKPSPQVKPPTQIKPAAQVRPPLAPRPVAPATRPAVVKPSSVPAIKRPSAKPAPGQASPLRVKPAPIQAKPHRAKPTTAPEPFVFTPRPRTAGPQSRAVSARPTPARAAIPLRPPASGSLALAINNSVNWMLGRSLGFKFRMVALTFMFMWLCGITVPVTVFSALTGPRLNVQPSTSGVAVNIDTASPIPVVALLQPTFTPTLIPSKTAPPTAIPKASPTLVAIAPTNTPPPAPTQRSAPPTPTHAPAGPVVAEVSSPTPNVDYKLTSVRRLTACENGGNHHLFVLVLDKDGNGISNTEVEFIWASGSVRDRTGKKLEILPALGVNAKTNPGFVNFPMYKGSYRVKVLNGSSEQTEWLTVDIPKDERCAATDNPIGNSLFHYSYLIVFQKTR